MFSTTKQAGFTLLEILVAIAISSIIIIGLFDIFKNVIDTRTYALKHTSSTQIVSKTILLMDKDIRCKIGGFNISNTFGVKKLTFKTTNSLKFAGSVPVIVSYYIKNEGSKRYLVREEENKAADVDMSIYLTDMFKKIDFKFYSKGDWVDSVSNIIRIYLFTKDSKKYVFTIRGMM